MNNNKSDMVSKMVKASELAGKSEVVKELFKYDVPVLYRPTKSMLRKPKEPGLLQLIENAMSEKEVTNLLNAGREKYKNASTGTKNKWEKAAQARISVLEGKK